MACRRGEPVGEPLGDFAIQEDLRSHEDDDAVPLESALRIAKRQDGAQRTGRLVEGLLEGGDVQIGLARVVR